MKRRQPSFIIFDLGNVLVHIHPIAFLQSLSIDTPENRLHYHVAVSDIVKRYERGDDSSQDFFSHLDELFNSRNSQRRYNHGGKERFSEDDFRKAMLSIVGEPIDGMEDLLQHVSNVVPLGLLSNTNPLHFDYCLQRFQFLRLFSRHFLSYQLNAFKPEREIFTRVIDQIPYEPENVLYIDDLAENVAAANDVGFWGHQFRGLPDLRQLLSELNLL